METRLDRDVESLRRRKEEDTRTSHLNDLDLVWSIEIKEILAVIIGDGTSQRIWAFLRQYVK
ncbi:hypothetical protein ACLOJK_013900 [Asimina triloba]